MNVFISYPSERLAEAKVVWQFLKELGTNPWLDKENLIAGMAWQRTIDQALADADLFVHLGSEATISKHGVMQKELNLALECAKSKPLDQIYIVIIRLEDVRLPEDLKRFQYLDFNDEKWRERLALSLRAKYNQLKREPSAALSKFSSLTPSADIIPRSINEKTSVYELSANFFNFSTSGNYFELVNSYINRFVFDGFFSFRRSFDEGDDTSVDTTLTSSWDCNVEVHFQENELISIKGFVYFYFAGAAHPNSGTHTMNFGGRSIGSFNISFVIDNSKENADFLQKLVKLDVRKQSLPSNLEDHDFWGLEDEDIEYLKPFNVFTFDNRGITLIFSPYDILPYACGGFEVLVEWRQLEGRLTDEFLKSELARLLPDWMRPAHQSGT